MLEQRLSDALGDAAMGLTVDDQRVHRPAHIIDRGVTDNLDKTHFRIDLDFAHVAAIGEARLIHGLVAFSDQRSAEILRQIGARSHGRRDFI